MNSVCAIMQVKNESAIINHSLDILSVLVDKAIIIDDNSEDDTVNLIKKHSWNTKSGIVLLQNEDRDRNEGREFRKCFDIAKEMGSKRIYISDADEICPPQYADIMKSLLRDSSVPIRLIRTEICQDQKTVYGRKGTGKLVIINSDDVFFNENIPIHTSQPNIKEQQALVPVDKCTLLHYGQCDRSYTIFKLLFYMLIENKALGKSIADGYFEYFKTYENFVQSTEDKLDEFLWSGSPIPYKHWIPHNVRSFCDIIKNENFDPISTIRRFEKIPEVKKLVLERCWS